MTSLRWGIFLQPKVTGGRLGENCETNGHWHASAFFDFFVLLVGSLVAPPLDPPLPPLLREKKPINRKHINIFWRLLWDNRPRDEPPPVPGTNGTKWRFYCGIKQRKAGLSQGRVPSCPGEGSRLSQGRFLFVPDTIPTKMFMFIGVFLVRLVYCYTISPFIFQVSQGIALSHNKLSWPVFVGYPLPASHFDFHWSGLWRRCFPKRCS